MVGTDLRPVEDFCNSSVRRDDSISELERRSFAQNSCFVCVNVPNFQVHSRCDCVSGASGK